MSLEKDVEEMYSIVQEIKQKEVEILKLRERLKARAEKFPGVLMINEGPKPVTVGTHKRGRPKNPTTPEGVSQLDPQGAVVEGGESLDDSLSAAVARTGTFSALDARQEE